ncbi:MAG: AMP-binding protein [Gammaproteobacteria bacterium]|nr:AMP-binding protein [Gammaproteobacteria bacterium]NIR82251.1 AMP-binding protein [Gammaproteobacteria bacterium]NIR91182.1 AMP-binding protein [Gammaproteobacteria bacterium]NIU03400.1 AMP-binding protein [Gammaproteobacteria bacterium]NIX84675.1 AMP-binding protein [Gammaproteobacteria bacterium]
MTCIVGRRTLRSLLEHRARATPRRTFVLFDDLDGGITTLTYAQFDARVNRTANLLRRLRIGYGDRINLHLSNCLEFLYLWFGAAKIGALIMPTNVASPPDELEYLVNHSRSRLIFTQSAHQAGAEEVRRRCPGVETVVVCDDAACAGTEDGTPLHALLAGESARAPAHSPDPSDEVGILYTSGTTARPKGVRVTHANYIYAGETVAKAIRLGPSDRHYVVLPLFHGNAQYYSTMSALVSGASMALTARFSASRYFERCIAHRCTVASLFAAPIRMLLAQERNPGHRRNRLRVVLFAQNVTEVQLEEWHQRFGAPLLQLWGMTETMGPPLMNPIDSERRNMSMGLPVMGYEVSLVDEQGAPVTPGQVGEIAVRGEPGWSLMAGYLDNPEATAQTIRGEWLMSGDNARQDAEGYFYFVDRAKDMIKRAGENVAASEVEAVIRQHPAVFDTAVVGVPDAMRDEAILAYVVLREGESAGAEAIIEWCRARLASFRVPSRVVFRPDLPRTSVGKIQKHILRAEALQSGHGQTEMT